MKRILLLLLMLLFALPTLAQEPLKAGVSLVEQVDKGFYGTWRVKSTLISTNSPGTFLQYSSDIWVLSKEKTILYLSNPTTGASASVKIEKVEGKTIIFKKNGDFGVRDQKSFQQLIDVVQLNLSGDRFSATNDLTLETFNAQTNSLIRIEKAKYKLVGEKISGN